MSGSGSRGTALLLQRSSSNWRCATTFQGSTFAEAINPAAPAPLRAHVEFLGLVATSGFSLDRSLLPIQAGSATFDEIGAGVDGDAGETASHVTTPMLRTGSGCFILEGTER